MESPSWYETVKEYADSFLIDRRLNKPIASAKEKETVTISREQADAYVALQRAAEYQLAHHFDYTVQMLSDALEQVRKAGVHRA